MKVVRAESADPGTAAIVDDAAEFEPRSRAVVVLTSIIFGLVVLLLGAAIVITYFAYDRQTSRVNELERQNLQIAGENRQIEREHVQIGARFAEQSREVRTAIRRANGAYAQGFRDGRKAENLPPELAPIRGYVARGFLVPLRVPLPLILKPLRVSVQAGGYTVRWPRVALFASRGEPLNVWTRQAWPGARRRARVDGRAVTRLVGPLGIVYAWRELGRTYAVLTDRRSERAARLLVRSMG